MLVDTHCHLDAARFDDDRAAMMERARRAGVARMITIGCDEQNSSRALGLAATHADVFASVGIHPHEAEKASADFIDVLAALATHPKCVAIGECGLDYFYDHAPRERQREVFARQVGLARQLNKPLVVHVRDAWDDCLTLLQAEGARDCGGVIHCFSGDWSFGKACLDLGFFLSIPGIVTFKNPGALPEVIAQTPFERLLVETDSPYLAPAPHRGQRNEPAFVVEVARRVAEIKGATYDDTLRQTGENAHRLFGLHAGVANLATPAPQEGGSSVIR